MRCSRSMSQKQARAFPIWETWRLQPREHRKMISERLATTARQASEMLIRHPYISHMAGMCISALCYARPDRVASRYSAEIAELSPMRRPFTATLHHILWLDTSESVGALPRPLPKTAWMCFCLVLICPDASTPFISASTNCRTARAHSCDCGRKSLSDISMLDCGCQFMSLITSEGLGRSFWLGLTVVGRALSLRPKQSCGQVLSWAATMFTGRISAEASLAHSP